MIARAQMAFMLAAMIAPLGGCEILAFPFFIANEIDKQGSHIAPAQYDGLVGESVAVMISSYRSIQAEFPEIVPRLTAQIAEELRANVDIAGYVPGPVMLSYQYENPSWSAMPFSDLAKDLGVTRLVFIDLRALRVNDPGNQYLYDGLAEASIGIVEADGPTPDDIVHELFVRVTFPDSGGFGPEDLSRSQVLSVLAARFVDRATWPFYDAEIPNDIPY